MEQIIIRRPFEIDRKFKSHWSFLENYLKKELKRLNETTTSLIINDEKEIIEKQIKIYNERYNTNFYVE